MKQDLATNELPDAAHPIKVALVGNPNCGKTSLFNAITGSHQRVGNYPGVTVEKRSGTCTRAGTHFEILDLPGTYSLTSYSPEERIVQEQMVSGNHDVIVVVVDSTVLKRALVLLAQVMQTNSRVVLALNMSDEAEKSGLRLDVAQMRALLGFPIVQTVGSRGTGVDELLDAIKSVAAQPISQSRLVLGEQLDQAIAALRPLLGGASFRQDIHDWVATKLLMNDSFFVETVQKAGNTAAVEQAAQWRQRLEQHTGLDISLYVSERYFGFVDGLLKEVTLQPSRADARHRSEAVDSVLANRVIGLPLFALVMFAIFWITFTVGEYPMGWIEAGFEWLGEWVSGFWAEDSDSALKSLLVDGIIGGVGGVIVFLPNILLLFLGLAILEDTGYMARAAFLMDKLMHKFGLHGKSFLPMLTGFGCSIPGIMATRTLENEKDRLTTMLVLPLMSCGARLPIWLLLVPAFFAPAWRAPMLWLIYTIGIVLAFLLALLLRKTVLKGQDAPFVMDLPPYRLPTLKAVTFKMLQRSWLYLKKAGTIILGVSIIMWFITAYPKKEDYEVDKTAQAQTTEQAEKQAEQASEGAKEADNAKEGDKVAEASAEEGEEELDPVEAARMAEDLEYSIAGRIGKFMEPVIRPLGFDWKLGTAMIGAFAAKEVFVAQLGIVYSMGETDEESESLRERVAKDYSPLTGFCMMLFMLISAPCMATIAVTRQESGKLKWALLQLGGLTVIAYVVTLIVYQVGRLFF